MTSRSERADPVRDHGVHYTPQEMAAEAVAFTLDRIFAEHAPTSNFIRSLRVGDIAMGEGIFIVEVCRYLANKLDEAWQREGFDPFGPEVARYTIANECIFGVELDKDAAAKARENLVAFVGVDWLCADYFANDLQQGDALVGLSLAQVARLDWDLKAPSAGLPAAPGRSLELAADAVLGAFFAHDRHKARRKELRDRRPTIDDMLRGDVGATAAVEAWSRELRATVPVLHWPYAFSHLFGHWDAMPSLVTAVVGNPPFVGGGRISTVNGRTYLDWLTTNWPEGGGRTDLCAYFFRRAFDLLGRGAMGLIATNTISQGDTRRGGLAPIVHDGGRIFRAHVHQEWPGDAAVTVSTVFVSKHGLAPDAACVLWQGPRS